jgi:hypothetical protein
VSSATFDLHGVVLEVESSSDQLLELVRRRLQFFESTEKGAAVRIELRASREHTISPPARGRPVYEPESGRVLYDEEQDELAIEYGRVRARCRIGAGEAVISVTEPVDEVAWAATRPLLTLPLLELLKRRGKYGLHAAGVVSGHHGVALAGGSGAGKTTLALALVRAGFGFLGDDMLFLAANGDGPVLLAFPDELDVSPATSSFFPELRPLLRPEPLAGAEKLQLPPDRLGGDLLSSARPAALLFPAVSSGPTSSAEPLSADEALLEVTPNVLLTERTSSQAHLDALGELVRNTHCFRVSLGRDFDELPVLVRGLTA